MTSLDIAAVRQEYMRARLDESDVHSDAIAQFNKWFGDAVEAQLPMVNAMTLATVAAEPAE